MSQLLSSTLPRVLPLLLTALLLSTPALAARQVGPWEWADVEHVVAIGDLHGDWDQYQAVMRAAGLIDKRGRWDGGKTHVVQTGDVPDRGPDTRRIIDDLRKLAKQAERAGGRIHMLIGNHDAMNVYGDLRYVTIGEYAAFKSRNSKRYQDLLWEQTLQRLEASDPERLASMDLKSYRREWESNYPLGWNEHRQAWGVTGDYGRWVLSNGVMVKVNDTLFLHGGLSAKFCRSSMEELTELVHDALENFDPQDPGILMDEYGPLWYRGLATDNEQQRSEMVDAILERYGARRMVLGHTPTGGVVWPRFDGRVILNDTGIAAHYGGHNAFLEFRPEGLVARYAEHSIPLPTSNEERVEYLRAVVALDPGNAQLQSRLQKMLMAGSDGAQGAIQTAAASNGGEADAMGPDAAQREAWLNPDNCR